MKQPSKCVVFFSGGIMSWAAAKRAVAKYGKSNTTLLFTDTLIEDGDLYRFLPEAASDVGAELVIIAEGRTPWQVFNDVKLIGNTRKDPCSRILKREVALKWLNENIDPLDTSLVFGIHFMEEHRLETEIIDKKTGRAVKRGVRPRYAELGFPHVEAPMCDSPYMSESDIHRWLADCGIEKPRLYKMGFSHNNCGGFCVKAGEGHFFNLLKSLPDVFAHHEEQERIFNENRPGKTAQTVLAPEVRQPDGSYKRVKLSLREFRERKQSGLPDMSLFGNGGCGCFLDD